MNRRDLARKELYDLVWTTPVTQLAKDFGISDVGLAKTCRRHDISLSPRGYWAKQQAGRRLPTRPLVPKGRSIDEKICLVAGEEISGEFGTALAI